MDFVQGLNELLEELSILESNCNMLKEIAEKSALEPEEKEAAKHLYQAYHKVFQSKLGDIQKHLND